MSIELIVGQEVARHGREQHRWDAAIQAINEWRKRWPAARWSLVRAAQKFSRNPNAVQGSVGRDDFLASLLIYKMLSGRPAGKDPVGPRDLLKLGDIANGVLTKFGPKLKRADVFGAESLSFVMVEILRLSTDPWNTRARYSAFEMMDILANLNDIADKKLQQSSSQGFRAKDMQSEARHLGGYGRY